MSKKGYPTKADRRKMNLNTRNKKLRRDMKSSLGFTYYLQTKVPDKIAVNWSK